MNKKTFKPLHEFGALDVSEFIRRVQEHADKLNYPYVAYKHIGAGELQYGIGGERRLTEQELATERATRIVLAKQSLAQAQAQLSYQERAVLNAESELIYACRAAGEVTE